MINLLPQIISHSAERYAESVAFKSGAESLSYADLATRVYRLAHMLIELGVRRGDRVGVYLDRGIESAIAIYGIMNSGAAYVPLADDSPPARNRFLIEDCGINFVVSNNDVAGSLAEMLSRDVRLDAVIGIDSDLPAQTVSWADVSAMPPDDPGVHILDEDLAYVMYTSGTTGLPKGIMHSHRSGLSYAKLSKDLYKIRHADRLANHSPLHFDISTLGYFTIPLAGGTTVIIDKAHSLLPASLGRLIESEEITIWYSVPLALIKLLQLGGIEDRNLDSLRWVLFGGESFPAGHLRKLMKVWPHARFSNVYGPAEVNQCTFYNLSEPPAEDSTIPLGGPWANTEIMIVAPDDTEVEPGETGELLVRTPTMMKGYWCQPELTESALFRRDVKPGCEEVFYRTGDLVRVNAKGEIEFQGRRDRQIKTRGYRVELDGIEAVLLSHPGVEEAAVYSYRNGNEGREIGTRIVPVDEARIDEIAIREHLAKSLPAYALPGRITFGSDIPRTAAGKIDHKLLEKEESKKLHSESNN